MLNASIENLKNTFSGSEWPEFVVSEVEENVCTLTLNILHDVRWFEGHFPEQPVLAGVVQTHWAGELGRHIFSISADFQRIDNLKFQTVIQPNVMLTLKLEFIEGKNTVKFTYCDAETSYSEGKIVFAAQ